MKEKLTSVESDELAGLYSEAENRMLLRMDFSVTDWLDEDKVKQFQELYKKCNGFCYDSTCGDCINCK